MNPGLFNYTTGLLMSIMLISGCKSVDERVEEKSAELTEQYSELIGDFQSLPECRLDWETAVSLLDSNLVMRNAEEEIIQAEVAIRRVFLDLIPELTMQGIYNQAVTQFTELTTDQFNANVNALFQVPGALRLRMDYYAATLALFAARKQYELAYREEVINLYTLFRKYEQMEQSRTIELLQTAHPYVGTAERSERMYKHRVEETELWLGLSSALGCFSNCWNVVTENLPTFDYLSTPPEWNDPEQVGDLYFTLQATELEAARLREMGIKFQYWPQLNMRVYSPSVYLLSAGDRGGFNFDADDIRFEASVSMRLDTSLSIRDQLREAKRSTGLLKRKLYEDAHERVKKLTDAYRALEVIETRQRQLSARMHFLASASAPNDYDLFEQHLTERIEVKEEMLGLETELDAIVPMIWLADESKWEAPDEAEQIVQ